MKVAIAGYGIEGEASYRYYMARGNEVIIADERSELADAPHGAMLILGSDAFRKLDDFDVIVRSPGVSPKKLPYPGKVWSATNEFFERAKQKDVRIIGVTGTKGKGTTCSLIASILRAAGKTVHLVGNIGSPALDVLHGIRPEDVVVYELSSFQLWDIKKSPNIAVVLAIEPDHLDVHGSFDDYLNAKANIRKFQYLDDMCVYHPTNEYARQVAGTELVNEPWNDGYVPYSLDFAHRYAVAYDDEVYVKDGFFCVQNRQICSIEHLKIPGKHNIENACAAISAITNLVDWPTRITDEHVIAGLEAFTGLPHRLKFVQEVGGVKYFDDSIATTPGSAIAAIRAFDAPKVIILGGSDKGADYNEIVELCRDTETKVVAIGQTGRVIQGLCENLGVECERIEGDMNMAVASAHEMAAAGSVVILSPASASFDMYKNYAERGNAFIQAVDQLKLENP